VNEKKYLNKAKAFNQKPQNYENDIEEVKLTNEIELLP
jgi:hypothetical protein